MAFNLFDFGLKKAGKVQIFDENSLDSEGNIIPFETQVAVLSHYLQLEGTIFECSYKEMALKIIEHWSKFLDEWH